MIDFISVLIQGLTYFFDSTGKISGFLFSDKSVATKTLFSILLFLVLYIIIDMTFRRKWYFTIFVTGIVTALSIISIPDEFLLSLLSGYGALGSSFIALIPLLILLVFTFRVKSNLVGQVAWVFYGVYYFAYISYSAFTKSSSFFSLQNIPEFGAIIVGILMFFFIPSIRHAIFKGELQAIKLEGEEVALQARTLHTLQKNELKGYNAKDN